MMMMMMGVVVIMVMLMLLCTVGLYELAMLALDSEDSRWWW